MATSSASGIEQSLTLIGRHLATGLPGVDCLEGETDGARDNCHAAEFVDQVADGLHLAPRSPSVCKLSTELSSAFLANCRLAYAQIADMELHERIKAARRRRGWEAKLAAQRLGVNEKTYYLHESGERNPKRDALKEYARAFRVPLEWLAFGQGSIEGTTTSSIPVYGYVGLGEEIDWIGEGGEVLEETDFPLLLNNPDIFALIGRGNSMAPLVHDGDIVIGKRPDGRLPGEFVGRKAIVKVADGPYLLKVIRRGSQPDRWNLESINQLYETRENEIIEHLAEYVGSFQRGVLGLR